MIVGVTNWGAGSPACTPTTNHRCQLGASMGEKAPHRSSGVRTTDRRGCPRPFGLDSGDPQGTTVDARPSMCVYQA